MSKIIILIATAAIMAYNAGMVYAYPRQAPPLRTETGSTLKGVQCEYCCQCQECVNGCDCVSNGRCSDHCNCPLSGKSRTPRTVGKKYPAQCPPLKTEFVSLSLGNTVENGRAGRDVGSRSDRPHILDVLFNKRLVGLQDNDDGTKDVHLLLYATSYPAMRVRLIADANTLWFIGEENVGYKRFRESYQGRYVTTVGVKLRSLGDDTISEIHATEYAESDRGPVDRAAGSPVVVLPPLKPGSVVPSGVISGPLPGMPTFTPAFMPAHRPFMPGMFTGGPMMGGGMMGGGCGPGGCR